MFLLQFFDDYISAGNRFQLVQGLESSFHALDLIVSQQKVESDGWRTIVCNQG